MTSEEAHQQLQHLVGTRYVPSIEAYIGELTGYSIVCLDAGVTRDFWRDRIRIVCDKDKIIQKFQFN